MPTFRKNRRPAFTLVELLVVFSIIAILVAMLIPAVQQARETARNSVCKSNQRQIAVAAAAYRADFGVYLPNFQSRTNDPSINMDSVTGSWPYIYGSSATGLLWSGDYLKFSLGNYSGPSGVLESLRRQTVILCPSGKYFGAAGAPGVMAYVVSPGSASGLDVITRFQDGYDTTCAGTTIGSLGSVSSLKAHIQSYSVNARFSASISVPPYVPGGNYRQGYTAIKTTRLTAPESSVLVMAEFFQRDGLYHGYMLSMANFLGNGPELSLRRFGYYRTPHGGYKTGNWMAMDGHVGDMNIDQLEAAWQTGSATLAAKMLPFEF